MTDPTRQHGFTLLEVMLALSIGAVIAAGATFGMITVFKSTTLLEKQAAVDEDAKVLLDAILGQVQELGGGVFRPNDMIVVTDNTSAGCVGTTTVGSTTLPDCSGADGSDRLTFIVLDDSLPQCELDPSNPTSGVNINFDQSGTTSTVCCDASDPTFQGDRLQGRTVMLIDRDNGTFTNRYCHNYQDNGSNCRCNAPPGQSGYNPPGGSGTANYELLAGGYSATIFLDQDEHVLKMVADRDADGTAEEYRLAPNVWDFQVELAFDTDNDGEVDTPGTSYAVVSDNTTLRLVRIGLVIGVEVPSRTTPSSGQVLNGGTKREPTGHLLRSVVGSTSLRNLYLFY